MVKTLNLAFLLAAVLAASALPQPDVGLNSAVSTGVDAVPFSIPLIAGGGLGLNPSQEGEDPSGGASDSAPKAEPASSTSAHKGASSSGAEVFGVNYQMAVCSLLFTSLGFIVLL